MSVLFILNIFRRVCEKALINIKKVVGLETTFGQGYNAFIHAIAKLIDSENILPVSFNLQANGEMKQSIEEERKSMKQWRHDRDRFQNETKNQARIIDEEIKRYQEKYRDVIRSKEDYDRADEDKTYSKLDVERVSQVIFVSLWKREIFFGVQMSVAVFL